MITYKDTGRIYGFTLVELIITITIIALLGSIGFYSYTQNLSSVRDTTRTTAIATLESQLTLYKKQRGVYPQPGNTYSLVNKAKVVTYSGLINQDVPLTTATNIPLDPSTDTPYHYAVTHTRQEFQLATTLENEGSQQAYIRGDYTTVAKRVLPTLFIAQSAVGANVLYEISRENAQGLVNRDLFIFDENMYNLPYDVEPSGEVSPGFDALLSSAEARTLWQNIDFTSCQEIFQAGKLVTPYSQGDEYQIRNTQGALIDITCNCTSTGCIQY